MPPSSLLARARAACLLLLSLCVLLLGSGPARASIAYGSLNNFDTVNDTGKECHGFEIELEDCHSTDITYTYDYNHYGTCSITEDNSVPGHPRCTIRWASKKNPDGTWSAYTAIPSEPITPTNGHMFTNPSLNFGGEHFGVGYRVAVGAVRYHWLVDDGFGTLIPGGAVEVSTPVFVYYPPAAGVVGQVQAEIQPFEPPRVPEKEFGPAVWVKEIRTAAHNQRKVKLRDLVSDDPADANAKDWRNGEPDEVEVEWALLQAETGVAGGGKNGRRNAAAEDLPRGDEVITRRYEFYKYTGPIDAVTGEALADTVAADNLHGVATQKVRGGTVDYSAQVIVGEYAGAQMAAVDVAGELGLVDHVSEGRVNTPYTPRALVVFGPLPVTVTHTGDLPDGIVFDDVTGILSGTPTVSGEFTFKIAATDGASPNVAKNYLLRIAAEGADLPAASLVDTVAAPPGTGATGGDGAYAPGASVTVNAVAAAGYRFSNWSDNGKVVSTSASYTFTIDVNHSLIANFILDLPPRLIALTAAPTDGGTVSGGGAWDDGSPVTVVATAKAGYAFTNWTEGGVIVSTNASYAFTATADRTLVANFTSLPTFNVSTGVSPAAGGTAAGGGAYVGGASATVTATANAGYFFTGWTVAGTSVSASASYTFTVTANRALVANFQVSGAPFTIATAASPTPGGALTGGGTYLSGSTATVTANANPGYVFTRWVEGNSNVSTSPGYSFLVTGSRTLTAKFDEAFVMTTLCSPRVGGTAELNNPTFKTGDRARARAFPAAGYVFGSWTENGAVVSTEASYTWTAAGNRTLVAHFLSASGVTIATDSAPAIGGATAGEGAYGVGGAATVSAFPAAGYGFVNWTEGGTIVSTDIDYSFAATANRSLVANFGPLVAVAATASPAAGGATGGAGTYAVGETVAVSVTPNPGYAFTGWTEAGAAASSARTYTFALTGARNLVANFLALPPLTVAPAAADTLISWPALNDGWRLEQSTDLSTWTPTERPVTSQGGRQTVTVPTSPTPTFYRLSHP